MYSLLFSSHFINTLEAFSQPSSFASDCGSLKVIYGIPELAAGSFF